MIRILKVMVLAGITILIISGYAAATRNMNPYRGELTSGSSKVGILGSNELWLLYGEKGNRIVISTVVDKGNSPPEIYLYPPGGSNYVIHSDVVSGRSQVIDYKLGSTGKYEVLIHPCDPGDPQDKNGYKIAYTKLAPGDSYAIQPDDPNGNLIKERNPNKPESRKGYLDRSGGIVPVSILLNLATFGYGPALFTLFTGVDGAFIGAVDLNNKTEVASRAIEEPSGTCNIMAAGVVSR